MARFSRARASACLLVPAFAAIGTVQAQHAADDPVAAASDAFGLTLGLESIGLYGPGSIRGFNPQAAGNMRIDGLYFDQQGALSNRVVEGSTIRIGASEIGYAFPAPTGIVDYELRHAGDGTPSATVVVSAGPFQARGASIDGNLPLIAAELQIPAGASYEISTQTPFGSPNPGYTSTVANIGATPQWKPNDQLTVRGIFDWTQTTNAKTFPMVFTAGDYLPPDTPRGYYGQNWAQGNSLSENYGGIVTAQLSRGWSLAAGIFRSIADSPVSYVDMYLDTQPNGSAEHYIVGNPDQQTASTSGEVRLMGHYDAGELRQEIVLLARGRDTRALYGGSDFIDLGPALIDEGVQVPEPIFHYSARTHDRTELWGAGASYRAQWQAHADVTLGVQQESYTKDVSSAFLPDSQLTDRPLRAYGTAAEVLNDRATAYQGYTQGLEDSGIAPNGAENRGAILPDARTWQADAGVRYLLNSNVKLISGVFEIEKPYFNFDTRNVDRALGVQRAIGLEMSLSGELAKNLDVTAATLIGEVKVIGPNLRAENVGSVAFGQPRVQATLNASYKFQTLPALSADIAVFHFGAAPASIDDVTQNRALTALSLGGRYRFTMLGAQAAFRAQIQNLTNTYYWNMVYSPGFSQFQPRGLFAYLTIDF